MYFTKCGTLKINSKIVSTSTVMYSHIQIKKAACQYWTILVTLYSHLLCTVMTDNFSRFSLVTKAPISFVICVCLAVCLFYYPSVCPSTSTSVRLFVRLSALYAPLPLERFAWNLISVNSQKICPQYSNLVKIVQKWQGTLHEGLSAFYFCQKKKVLCNTRYFWIVDSDM